MKQFRKYVAALLLTLPLCGVPAAEPENLLPDAELTNAKQWLTRKGYSLAPGEGRGGANALVYERTNPKDYPLPGIGLKLPPGSYEFGGWVYCERNGSNEVGAAICMEMSENGKHIGGSYRAQRTGPADWRKVSSVLIVPENRKNVRVQFVPYMQKGNCGRIKFSDMYIRRADPVLYTSILKPRMFHSLQPGKNKLQLGVSVMNTAAEEAVLNLTLSGEAGKIAEKQFPAPGKRVDVEFDFPAGGRIPARL